MTTLAIVWLACLAVLLELVHRAPVVDWSDETTASEAGAGTVVLSFQGTPSA